MKQRKDRIILPLVAVALGTNLGDREGHLQAAVKELKSILKHPVFSRIYSSEPVGYLEQPWFLNQVCVGESSELPLALLAKFKTLEKARGRVDGPRFGPRPLDLDLLFYDQWVMDSAILTLPHPRMLERSFVIRPLLELLPAWTDPRSGAHLQTVWAESKDRLTPCIPQT
ncbi:MAG TPA: 2-amino-4-hydroxy-6-hydroxymethyldihydropteridine diphosphokinase [Firmicutes bacterium]|nr:2-amino-4-hydroxy-6-hydroxymethyldihydropteridine diphosphokinase [Bacillota bacterium]